MSHLIRRAHGALLLVAVATCAPSTLRPVDATGPSGTPSARARGDRGQTTAEYGLVLLGAAGIAMLLVAWATKSGAIGKLFDAVLDNVIGKVK